MAHKVLTIIIGGLAFLVLPGTLRAQDNGAFVTADGLRIEVLAADPAHPNAVRIEVTPSDIAAPATERNVSLVRGNCRVSFDPAKQTLSVRHGDERPWTARWQRLDNFGRAQVPGLEVAWQAERDEALYGLGERFDALNVAGRRVEMWIEDEPGQRDGSASYFVTPVLFSSEGYGFFAADNPEGVFDLNSAGDGWNRYQRAGEAVVFTVAFGPDLESLVRLRGAMIGGLEPAPAWAYAPWISRNSYETQAEAEDAMDGMRQRGLPFGVIVLEAWKGRSETGEFNRFSTERWPDVGAFMARCARENVKVVLWQVPVLHPSSPWYMEAKDKAYLVRDAAGAVSLREQWLAGFGNVDFLNPDAAAFWKDMLRPVVRMGIAGFKADDGEAIKPTDRLGDGVPGWRAHNDYSTLYNRATYELFKEEGVDGMLWARSGSVGIEAAPGLWAGDQGASWEQLNRLVTAGLSASISGMPYWGHDIGGYFGACEPELYVRWLQFGALSPFMQFHGQQPREPWYFGDEAIDAYRLLAGLRMNLRPTLIELGDHAAKTGLPIMRPMCFVTGEHAARGLVDQYTLGDDLLVAPVMEQSASGRIVHFPKGRWLHALSPMVFDGPGDFSVPIGLVDAPLFIREGAVLRVALGEGHRLGAWSGDESAVTMTATPQALWGDVPVLRNVDAPRQGDPFGGGTVMRFGVDPPQAKRLRARWWFEDAPAQTFDVPITVAPDGDAQIDLSPSSVSDAVGRRQVYELVDDAGPQPVVLLRSTVDWRELVRVTINDPNLDVVVAGSMRLTGEVVNRSAQACNVELTLALPDDVRAGHVTRTIRLGPGERAALDWALDVAEQAGRVGDCRVVVEARVGDVTLGRAEVALIRAPRWLVAGPFPAESKAQGFAATTSAERSFGPEVRFPTANGELRWTPVSLQDVADMNGLDFNRLFGFHTNAFAYATAVIHSDREQRVQLRVGTDDTLSLWVNGDLLVAKMYDRPALPDQDVVDVVLKQGDNRVLIKVAQGEGGWGLLVRITSPDGGPVIGLTDGLRNVGDYMHERTLIP